MTPDKKKLDEIAKIMQTCPPRSAKYKKAMAELDGLLGMDAEPPEEDHDELPEAD